MPQGIQRVTDEKGKVHVFPPEATPEMIAEAMGVKYDAPAKSTTDKAWDWAKHAVSSVNETFHPLDMISGAAHGVAAVSDAMFDPNKAKDLVVGAFKGIEGESERLNKLARYGTETDRGSVLEAVPFVGPQLSEAVRKAKTGDWTGAVGNAAGIGLNVEAPRLAVAGSVRLPGVVSDVRQAAQTIAANRSLAKRGAMDTAFARDLGQAVPASKATPYNEMDVAKVKPYLMDEHQTAAIDSVPRLIEAADTGIGQIEDKIAGYIAAVPGETIATDAFKAAWNRVKNGVRSSDVWKGMENLRDLDLQRKLSLEDADAIRKRLNAENKAVLLKNKYDVATAREADPKFAAREAAAQALKDGIYERLDQLGTAGVKELRLDEGSLIKVRNAAERQKFSTETGMTGTGKNSLPRRIGAAVAAKGGGAIGAGVGAATAGPAGAVGGSVAGHLIGQTIGDAIVTPNLSRNALVQRAFDNLRSRGAVYPPNPVVPPGIAGPAAAGGATGAGPRGPFGGGGGPSGGPQGPYGPRPTVTIVPPGQIGPPGPPGLPPAPGGAGSAAPLQLGPRGPLALGPRTTREMGTGKPDYRAPRIPTVPLPTTWSQLDEFTGKAPDKATGQDPSLIGEALTEGNDAGSRPGVGRPTYVEIPKWDDTPAGKREKAAQQRKFEAKAKASEANGTALDFEGETDFAFGDNVPAGKTADAVPDKRVSIPAAYQSHFDTLVADARSQGAKETKAQLAAAYRHHLNGAVEAVKEFYGAEADTSWRTLLKGISAAGGIGVDADAGMAGEVSHLMEDMGKEMKGKRAYTKGGKEFTRTAPVTSRGVKGIPGIVKGKGMGGYPLDTIREALEESGDFPPGKYDNLADLLEDIKSALRMAQNPEAALNAVVTPDRVQMAMDRVQDVRPGSKWWGK